MNPLVAKLAKTVILKYVQAKLIAKIPDVVDTVIGAYDANLNGIVTNRKSKTRPESYQPLFEDRLESFEFFTMNDNGPVFRVPEMDTFKFNNGLEIIETICEGLPGKYVTVTGEQYKNAMGKDPQVLRATDNDVPRKERVYLIRDADPLKKKIEKALNEKLPLYEFSNFPPVDIFKDANDLVNDELTGWVDEAIVEAMKNVSKN